MIGPEAVEAAAHRIAGIVRHTPLELSPDLSERLGCEVWLKMEIWQHTGSFKIRGAANYLSQLSLADREAGIITVSAGNHAQGIATCATAFGVPALIVVPQDASPAKIAAMRRYDPRFIDLQIVGRDYDEAEAYAISLAQEKGRPFVSGYNHEMIIAGQGTIGVEMLADVPDLDVFLIPVGGGGLSSGIALWARHQRPECTIIGVQSEASPSMYAAFQAGEIAPIPVAPSLADGLAGNIEAGSITVPLCLQLLNEVALVSEAQIAAAMRWLIEEHHLIVEGSGAVGVAALLFDVVKPPRGSKVGVVLTGRNITAKRVSEILGGSGA